MSEVCPDAPHNKLNQDAEIDLRAKEAELRLKEVEIELKKRELADRPGSWKNLIKNPIVIGAILAAYAGVASAMITWMTSE